MDKSIIIGIRKPRYFYSYFKEVSYNFGGDLYAQGVYCFNNLDWLVFEQIEMPKYLMPKITVDYDFSIQLNKKSVYLLFGKSLSVESNSGLMILSPLIDLIEKGEVVTFVFENNFNDTLVVRQLRELDFEKNSLKGNNIFI